MVRHQNIASCNIILLDKRGATHFCFPTIHQLFELKPYSLHCAATILRCARFSSILQNVPFCCPIKLSSDCDLDLVSALYHDKSSARVENLRSCRIIWDHLCLIVCLQLRRQNRQTKRHWVTQVETFPSCRPVFYVWNKEICSEDGIEFLFLQK